MKEYIKPEVDVLKFKMESITTISVGPGEEVQDPDD